MNGVHILVFIQGSRAASRGKHFVVTKGRTLLVISQVSSGLKKIACSDLQQYHQVKIARLVNVKPYVTVSPIQIFGLYSCSGLPLRLSPLTEDTSMITVSSCGVKLKEVLSLNIHMHFCGFSQQSFIHSFIHSFFFHLWCNLLKPIFFCSVKQDALTC